MPKAKGQKRKRKVTLLQIKPQINESSLASIQSVGEDPNEDDEMPVESAEPVPDEGGESDIEPFEGLVGMDGMVVPREDEEPVIEDFPEVDDAEPLPVPEPKKPPPPLVQILKKDAIDCPTLNCIHRVEIKRGPNKGETSIKSFCLLLHGSVH